MTDTVNVDTLVETIRDGLTEFCAEEYWAGDTEPSPLAALSDLAARARQTESQDWYTEWYEPMKRRAGAAEADRDRLARRVAELEAALREVERYFGSELPPAGFPLGAVRAALTGDGSGA